MVCSAGRRVNGSNSTKRSSVSNSKLLIDRGFSDPGLEMGLSLSILRFLSIIVLRDAGTQPIHFVYKIDTHCFQIDRDRFQGIR